MDLNTYNDFEETLLGLVRENYLRDIMKHTCRRAFDNIQIRGGAQPVFNPMTIFDDPNYVPPTEDRKSVV